jgi:carbon storage regulator
MLVLTRKYQEKIRIGDNITITVLRTKGKAVRLGIEAPSDVPVIRGELSFETAGTEAAGNDVLVVGSKDCATQRSTPRHDGRPEWAPESPRRVDGQPRDSQRPQVQHKRLSRDEVAKYLPELVAGVSPLRAMMEQR